MVNEDRLLPKKRIVSNLRPKLQKARLKPVAAVIPTAFQPDDPYDVGTKEDLAAGRLNQSFIRITATNNKHALKMNVTLPKLEKEAIKSAARNAVHRHQLVASMQRFHQGVPRSASCALEPNTKLGTDFVAVQ